MLEAALEPSAASHEPYCSLQSLASLGGRAMPDEGSVQVVVTRTFINVVPIDTCEGWNRQISSPAKLGGEVTEPRESDAVSSVSSTASGTHSLARESDFAIPSEDRAIRSRRQGESDRFSSASSTVSSPHSFALEIASEDEVQRQDLLQDNIDNLEDHPTLLDEVFRETASNVFVRDFEKGDCPVSPATSAADPPNSISPVISQATREKNLDKVKPDWLATVVTSPSAHVSSTPSSRSSPKKEFSFSSKNRFAQLRQGDASSEEDSADDVNTATESPDRNSSVQEVVNHTKKLDETLANSVNKSAASPAASSGPSKNVKRKLRLAAKAAEAAEAAALQKASNLASAEQEAKKKIAKPKKSSSNAGATTPYNKAGSVSATAAKPKLIEPKSSGDLKNLSAVKSSMSSTNNASGLVQCEMTNARLHATPAPQVSSAVSELTTKQRLEMKQATLAVFRELKGAIDDTPHLENVGEISYLQLAKFGPKSCRRLVSVYGDIFDVTSAPDKYGMGGQLSWHTGKDVTWALITGSTKNVNGFYDVFKSGELLQRYLRLLCSCIVNFEREYGKPVGRLAEWRDEQSLPPPPLTDTAECCLM